MYELQVEAGGTWMKLFTNWKKKYQETKAKNHCLDYNLNNCEENIKYYKDYSMRMHREYSLLQEQFDVILLNDKKRKNQMNDELIYVIYKNDNGYYAIMGNYVTKCYENRYKLFLDLSGGRLGWRQYKPVNNDGEREE